MALFLAAWALPTPARGGACHLAVAFGLDATSSLSVQQVRQMRSGLAEALVHPQIKAALRDAGAWLYVYEWAGRRSQQTLVGWTPDPRAAAAGLLGAEGVTRGATAYGEAMLHGYRAVAEAGCWDGVLNMVIDGYGAGDSHEGIGPEAARAQMDPWFQINAVLVAGAHLQQRIEAGVIQGPFAFVEHAEGTHDFAEAMMRKIRLEIALMTVGE